jgi:Flp pilus assembly pilin Flp
MKNIKKFFKSLWKDESAQGATEYILLVVVIVAIAGLFREQIKAAVSGKLDELKGSILGFKGE